MRNKLMPIVLFISFALLLSGCQTTYLVHDSSAKQIAAIIKDYGGAHGYSFTYENETTWTYGLDLGSVYIPYTSTTVKSSSYTQVQASTGQPVNYGYEDTSWNTITSGPRNVEALATIRLIQQDKDVLILIDTNDAGGYTLNDIRGYVQAYGFTVDEK